MHSTTSNWRNLRLVEDGLLWSRCGCSGKVSSSCSTSDTRSVNLATNPVISHEWGNDREVFTTSWTYPWSFVTQIFHQGQPSHGGDRSPSVSYYCKTIHIVSPSQVSSYTFYHFNFIYCRACYCYLFWFGLYWTSTNNIIWIGLWCLAPLLTIFHLYRGGQFYVTILLDSNKYIHMLQNDRIQRTTYYIMRWSSPGINQ